MARMIPLTAGGVHWEVDPHCRDRLFGPDGLRLQEWLDAGQAGIVKHGPHRTVYRVNLPGLRFYLKHYRLADHRAWFRELVRPAKARTECRRALAVAARQVPTVEPLALGEQPSLAGPGDSYLITRSLDETEPLNGFIDGTLPTFDRVRRARIGQRLAHALGALIAAMHDAGIVHNDLHPGNLLVRLDKDDRPGLFLIDLHAVKVSKPLGWRASRANLTMLNRWFVLRVGRADRLRFWRSYCQARVHIERCPRLQYDLARDLEKRTWASNLVFWRSRDQRSLVTNRYYRKLRAKGATGYAVQDLDAAVVSELLADPDRPFQRPEVRLLKDSRSATVAELEVSINGVVRPVIYKRFRLTSTSDPWVNLLRPPAALRSWVHGHGLRERCLPTPRPLAVLHRTGGGLLREGYLLMEKVTDARDLHAFLASQSGPALEQRREFRGRIEQVARLVRQLHRCRMSHRDLKASNVLLTAAGVHLIDLVGVVRHRKLGRRRKVQNLARLHASFWLNPRLTRTDKLRFLRVYLQLGLFGRGRWKRWWNEVAAATLQKAAQNAKRGRVLA